MARETIVMSYQAAGRGSVIASVLRRQLTQAEAARQLRLCVRQVKRLVGAYQRVFKDWLSKHRGKPAHNAIDTAVRNQALELVRALYGLWRDIGS